MDHSDPMADRLRALESAVPCGELPTDMFDTHPNKPRRLKRLGIVVGLIAAMLLSGAAGASVHQVMTGVKGSPGVFSPGSPLACSPIQHMNPVEAGKALAALGYVVTWQIEYRAEDPNTHEGWTSSMSSTPPADGYVIEGVLEGNQLLILVERGPAAHPMLGC
jgi:hypothetical protein